MKKFKEKRRLSKKNAHVLQTAYIGPVQDLTWNKLLGLRNWSGTVDVDATICDISIIFSCILKVVIIIYEATTMPVYIFSELPSLSLSTNS